MFRAVFGLVAVGLAGCGGEMDTDQRSEPGASTNGSHAGAGGGHTSGPVTNENLLADCTPGFTPEQATADKPCQFFVGTTCYATQEAACGCACPRNQGPVVCVADGNKYLAGTAAYGVWCVPRS